MKSPREELFDVIEVIEKESAYFQNLAKELRTFDECMTEGKKWKVGKKMYDPQDRFRELYCDIMDEAYRRDYPDIRFREKMFQALSEVGWRVAWGENYGGRDYER